MKKVAAVIIALLLIGKAQAQITEPVALPSQVCRGYFFVPVTLEVREGESPADRTLWFLYDTGASTSYVDPDSLERVAGRRINSGVRASFGEVSVGDLQLTGLRARVRDLDHLSIALGREIDGILEFDAFEDVLLTLDYAVGEMRVVSGALPQPDNVTIFDANGPDTRPWLRIGFPGGEWRRLLIDSGAALSGVILRNIERYDTLAPPRATGAAVRFSEVERRSAARLRGNLMIGDHALEQPVIQSTPETELIGGEVMRHFSWTFDQRHERVQVLRNDPAVPITFEPMVTHGLVLVPEDDGMRVAAVIANSPAFDAGVEIGDFVTHFNGSEMRTRSCELGGEPPATLDLSLIRDGAPLELTLRLYPLVD
ncbi:PDZ domain-containing protein [Maricaulis sp.]|uniref:PDZ domain-containing protein n=1 Tax=Maricaulis sp. TaxID=1486257 RepID=UPI0025BC8356|nr:PDZ domain-containing protein [Maricaulis sp.]